MKKSEKNFSATARLADALAGRIYFPMRLAEGFFLPFFTREISLFLWGGGRRCGSGDLNNNEADAFCFIHLPVLVQQRDSFLKLAA